MVSDPILKRIRSIAEVGRRYKMLYDWTMSEFGVFSEIGKLRKVLVHRPDLSLKRLTPANHDEFLFDDVLWV